MQRTFKLRLPPDGRPTYIRQIEESILNDHRTREPEACGEQFARVLRKEAQTMLRALTECPPVALPITAAYARGLKAILTAACRLGLVPPAEAVISTDGGWACHTVLDHAAALERAVRDGRAPRFASQRDEQFAELTTKLDTLAAICAATAAKVGVRAEEVCHD